jgi:hypothetical protein
MIPTTASDQVVYFDRALPPAGGSPIDVFRVAVDTRPVPRPLPGGCTLGSRPYHDLISTGSLGVIAQRVRSMT